MNCEKIQEAILEGRHKLDDGGDLVKNHIKKCYSCREFARRQEMVRQVVIKGLQGRVTGVKSGKNFARLFNKKIRAFRGKVALLVSAIVLAVLVMLPLIQPTFAYYYPDFFKNMLRADEVPELRFEMFMDEGLLRASDQAPVLDLSVTDQDITFTVHQLIADSVRVVLIATWDDPEDRLKYGMHPQIELSEIWTFLVVTRHPWILP